MCVSLRAGYLCAALLKKMDYKVKVCVSRRAGYLCAAGLTALLKNMDYKVSVCVTPYWLPVRSRTYCSAQEDELQGKCVCLTLCAGYLCTAGPTALLKTM